MKTYLHPPVAVFFLLRCITSWSFVGISVWISRGIAWTLALKTVSLAAWTASSIQLLPSLVGLPKLYRKEGSRLSRENDRSCKRLLIKRTERQKGEVAFPLAGQPQAVSKSVGAKKLTNQMWKNWFIYLELNSRLYHMHY